MALAGYVRACWASCLVVAASGTGAQELYGLRQTATGSQLVGVDTQSGAERALADMDFGQVVHAVDANSHRLYLLGEWLGGPVPPPGQAYPRRIVTVSLVDGSVVRSPAAGDGNSQFFALAFHPSEHALYAVRASANGGRQLCKLNAANGAVTALGTGTPSVVFSGSVGALDAAGRRFFFLGAATFGGVSRLYTFDTQDGSIDASPFIIGSDQSPILGLAYDPRGVLLGVRRLSGGSLRLVTINPSTGKVQAFQPTSAPVTFPSSGQGMALDATHARFFVAASVAGEARLLAFNTVDGTVSSIPLPETLAEVRALAWRESSPLKGDFDRDGRTDLLLRRLSTNETDVWLMHDTTRASTAALVPTPGSDHQIVGVDDFNANGVNDLAVYRPSTRTLEFWMLGGASGTSRIGDALPLLARDPTSGVLVPAPPRSASWQVAATGDFNHDGWPDLVWRDTTTGKLEIWIVALTIHTATVLPNPAQSVDLNWEIAAALDFNRDGNRDLLFYNRSSGRITTWNLDAAYQRIDGDFTTPMAAGDNNWRVVAGGDYGVGPDGPDAASPVVASNDIVWRNQTSGRLVVWHMDFSRRRSGGVFTTPDAPSPSPTGWSVAGPR